jgi:hypothetical protein
VLTTFAPALLARSRRRQRPPTRAPSP